MYVYTPYMCVYMYIHPIYVCVYIYIFHTGFKPIFVVAEQFKITYVDFGTDMINLLKTKRNLFYIRNLSVPRSEHFLPRL